MHKLNGIVTANPESCANQIVQFVGLYLPIFTPQPWHALEFSQTTRDDNPASAACMPVYRLYGPMRHFGQKWGSAQAPAACAGHVGFHPCLIDKDQAPGVWQVLMQPSFYSKPRRAPG